MAKNMTIKQNKVRNNPKLAERGYQKIKEIAMDPGVRVYMKLVQELWSINHGLAVKRGLAYAKEQRLKNHGKQK